ncbi:putative AP2 domain-containing protein [Vibrio phage VPMCC14]|nr:putative AP2 domain-containing protein [Vibrio phage VPMCC14]
MKNKRTSKYLLHYDSTDKRCSENKIYTKWKSLHRRVTNVDFYKDCSVCSDWCYYSEFKKWVMNELSAYNHSFQLSQLQLDKDILNPFEGNKLYSPEKCILIPQELNKFTTFEKKGHEFKYIGAHLDKRDGYYYTHCNNPFTRKSSTYGRSLTAEEAHKKWCLVKSGFCRELVEKQIYKRDIINQALLRTAVILEEKGGL